MNNIGFFEINDIVINGDKSELLVINSQLPNDQRYVTMGKNNSKVFAVGKNQDVSFLGVWINSSLTYKNNIKRIQKVITDFVNTIKFKKATISQLRYIYNNVILPKIEYLHQITKLNNSQCHKIERKAIQCLKHLFGLPITTNDNILFSEMLLDVKRLWDNYTESHITAITKRLNSTKLDGMITEIRLIKAQLQNNSTNLIFDTIEDWIMNTVSTHNIAVH